MCAGRYTTTRRQNLRRFIASWWHASRVSRSTHIKSLILSDLEPHFRASHSQTNRRLSQLTLRFLLVLCICYVIVSKILFVALYDVSFTSKCSKYCSFVALQICGYEGSMIGYKQPSPSGCPRINPSQNWPLWYWPLGGVLRLFHNFHSRRLIA